MCEKVKNIQWIYFLYYQTVSFHCFSKYIKYNKFINSIVRLKLIKNISRYNFVLLRMKTNVETFKQHYFPELVFQSSWKIIFFSITLELCPFNHNIFTSNDFFNLWEEITSKCKPTFVTIFPFLYLICSNLHFYANKKWNCLSPSISMLILILIFQSRTERLIVTVACLLCLILICFTLLFHFFQASVETSPATTFL